MSCSTINHIIPNGAPKYKLKMTAHCSQIAQIEINPVPPLIPLRDRNYITVHNTQRVTTSF